MFEFKRKLQETTSRMTAHVVTIPSATVTQAVSAAGADAVIIDLEHGVADYAATQAMIAATQGTACAPLVRVGAIDETEVKRVLDLGAEGIAFPMIRTAEDAARAVASLRYPPDGTRGFGPFVAHSHFGVPLMDYMKMANGNLACCLLAETCDAVENIGAICAVPGVDLILPAQFDLSVDLGIPGQFDHPLFLETIGRIEAAAHAANIPLANVALDQAHAERLFERGYRVIMGVDLLWLTSKTSEMQGWTLT